MQKKEAKAEEEGKMVWFNRNSCGWTMYPLLCATKTARNGNADAHRTKLYSQTENRSHRTLHREPRPQSEINLACIKINSVYLRTFTQATICAVQTLFGRAFVVFWSCSVLLAAPTATSARIAEWNWDKCQHERAASRYRFDFRTQSSPPPSQRSFAPCAAHEK